MAAASEPWAPEAPRALPGSPGWADRPSVGMAPGEWELWASWEERVARYRAGDASALPPAVIGLGRLRMVGGAAATLPFPRVRALSDLAGLPDDVQVGVRIAERAIRAYRASGGGRIVYAAAPAADGRAPEPGVAETLDPTRDLDILIIS